MWLGELLEQTHRHTGELHLSAKLNFHFTFLSVGCSSSSFLCSAFYPVFFPVVSLLPLLCPVLSTSFLLIFSFRRLYFSLPA